MRNTLIWIIKLSLTAAIIAAIVWKLDIATIVRTLMSASLVAVAAGLLLAFLQALLAAKRLAVVASMFGRFMPFGDALRVTLEGMFFSQTFVSFLGGDAQRIWRLRNGGFSFNDSVSAIALDRFIGIMVNHFVVLLAMPFLFFAITSNSIRIGLLAITGGGLIVIMLALCMGFMHGQIEASLPDWLRANRLVRLLSNISTVCRHLFILDARVASVLTVTFIMSMINCFIFFIVLWGWNVPLVPALGCALLVPAVLEVAMLPISVAGWGVREGVIIFAFATFGVSADIAFGSSITFALIVLTIGLIGGLLWLFDHRVIGTMAAIVIDPKVEAPDQAPRAAER
jgi:glycosyltransferase 2 family protein